MNTYIVRYHDGAGTTSVEVQADYFIPYNRSATFHKSPSPSDITHFFADVCSIERVDE